MRKDPKIRGDGKSLRRRIRRILAVLATLYPDLTPPLRAQHPFDILIATILSAQCTDAKVNRVLPTLFRRYPDPASLATAPLEKLESILRPLGLFRTKARKIRATAEILCNTWQGQIPSTMEGLLTLPGVGRKTANCVLVHAFHQPGLMCDTHCCRVSRRLGLTEATHPDRIEKDLAQLLPPEEWGSFSLRIIQHGRQICHARNPECDVCPLQSLCESGKEQRTPVRETRQRGMPFAKKFPRRT